MCSLFTEFRSSTCWSKKVTANLSAECPQINTKIEVKTKVEGKSVIEQSLKKTKARLNAAYAILFKKEIQ